MSRTSSRSEPSTPAIKAFGPTALLTPANALTVARLVGAPLFAVAVARIGPASWLLWVLWVLLASSDGLDGRIARWHGTTRSGAFLDPLADKFLVVGALAALVDLHAVNIVAVLIIAGREVAMSGYRVVAARRGISIPARGCAKLKTLLQDVAVGFAFFPPLGRHHLVVAQDTLWVAVVLTIVSGVQYVTDGRRLAAAQRAAASSEHVS